VHRCRFVFGSGCTGDVSDEDRRCYRLLHPLRKNYLAVIQRTGAGKTHTVRTLGVMERGIVLIFIPLLTLSADVMSKFTSADQRFGAVTVQHLDELYAGNKKVFHDLLERCRGLRRSTTTTVFIFLSPQFLINHTDARDVFIACSHRATLRVVAIDEAHVHVQHGTSFRSEIRALQTMFFAKLFGNQLEAMMRKRLIVLTATLPTNYLPPLCHLLTIPLLSDDSILRGSTNEFEQREIDKGQFISRGLTMIAEFIRANPTKSAVVFCNSRRQSQHFRDNLERKLNEMKLNVDVHKTDKFWRIRLFCDEGHIREADFRVLVTTNASNVGIDKLTIGLQVRFEWTRDLPTYFQERGRGSRQRGVSSICVLYADLSSYAYLVYQLHCGDENYGATEGVDVGECDGFNSAISPQRSRRRPSNITEQDFALGPTAKKALRSRCLVELNDVLRFFCLDFGCQHKRGEIYLSSGALDSTHAVGRCNTCPICNRTYHKDFIPVYRTGVVSYLEWLIANLSLSTPRYKYHRS
jgi:superfamily II DNA helicase RecQ